MILVRGISILLALFLYFAAFKTPTESIPFLLGGTFFLLMAFWGFRNKGSIDGPYIYIGASTVAFMYLLTGLISGQYTFRRLVVSLKDDPQGFWSIFVIVFLFGIGTLAYAIKKLRKLKRV